MTELVNTRAYPAGTKVWWYNDNSELCSGTVHQTVVQPEGSVAYIDCGGNVCRAVALWKCWPAKWIARTAWHGSCLMSALWAFLTWGVLWVALEMLLYGEVQPRMVDDLISLPVLVALYFLFRFKSERNRLKR